MDGQTGEYWGVLFGSALVALYVFSWISVGGLPRLGRWMVRSALALLIVVPLALYYLQLGGVAPSRDIAMRKSAEPPAAGGEAKPGAGAPAASRDTGEEAMSRRSIELPPSDDRAAPPPASAPAAAPQPVPSPIPSPPPSPVTAPPPAKPDTAMEGPADAAGQGRGAGEAGEQPAGAGAPVSEPSPSRGLGTRPAEEAAVPQPAKPAEPVPAPAATAEEKAEEFDVVPVFYGTDRAGSDKNGRVSYTADRGRRLELGRALVTIPKAHEVPGIERPWSFTIPYLEVTIGQSEDPNKHFTMKELKALSEADFLALVAERLKAAKVYKEHAFVFVHGFNTSFDFAIFRAAQITYDLKFDGIPFAYSWPSRGGVSSYTYDRESSGQSQRYLKDFLQLVIDKSGAKAISIIAHSMGNQPTLQVLKDLKAAKPQGVVLSQIILAAPDVDRDNFENIAEEIQGLAKGITLYAAANDHALYVSRGFNGGVPRAGDVPEGQPLVLPGVDTIDVTAASTDSLGLNHSGYAENNALLKDIGVLLQTDQRPPKLRLPALDEIKTDKGLFWRYPAAP